MKKQLLKLIAVLSFSAAFSQVGVNTTDPQAQLDIRSTDQTAPSNTDGILIPKIDAFPAINPTINQNGMMVFLTTAVGPKLPGFYYWDNSSSSWIGLASSTGGWALNGNAGTVAGTDFLGTSDAQPLDFRTNNIIRARITTKGQIEMLNTGKSVFMGEDAGAADDLTDNLNVNIGYQAGKSNSTGTRNVAVGSLSLTNSTTGTDNISLGTSSLFNNTTGGNNIAVGSNTLTSNTTGYR